MARVERTAAAALARLRGAALARPRTLLILAVLIVFAPAILQFVGRGVPENLFTGDAAVLELRTLQASHGRQLLGPYSRFLWSHPGPAFFYLALPIYEAFHRHGPALNLFALLVNLAASVGLALGAWRLRGLGFALVAVTLLAVYVGVAAPFQLSAEWNPMTPILPLGFLSFLAARIGLGVLAGLPLAAFVASAMVQTHVGFAPVVFTLAVMATILNLRAWSTTARRPTRLGADGARAPIGRRYAVGIATATAAVLLAMWILPLVENATRAPGNLQQLWTFFTAPHRPDRSWPMAVAVVSSELVRIVLAVPGTFGIHLVPSAGAVLALALAELGGVVAVLVVAVIREDEPTIALASIALAEIADAVAAVHAIRGEMHPYLVCWVSVIGLVAATVLAGGLLALRRWAFSRWAAPARLGPDLALALTIFAGVAIFGLGVRAEARGVDVFGPADQDAERFAEEIRSYLVAHGVDRPCLTIASHDVWPTAAAVVLYLEKRRVPIVVERDWLFMMGDQLEARSPPAHRLLLGEGEYCPAARGRPELHWISTVAGACAFVD